MQPARIQGSDDHASNVAGENGLFSTRRPKDAVAGLSSGLKNVGKGVFGGLASLVVLPVQGAREDGVRGFATGIAMGAVAAVGMTVAGVSTGVVQIGRGIANTPNAIRSKFEEKVWDEESRTWYLYSLPEDAKKTLVEFEEDVVAPQKAVDTKLYDIIGVSSTAPSSDIKKAYRVKALALHPDKNKNNPQFQELGAAYQILMDDNLRAAYDRGGEEAIKGQKTNLMDSSQLFELVFGSQYFESFIGELKLLSMSKGFQGHNPSELSEEEQRMYIEKSAYLMERNQKIREVKCALNLAGYLGVYVLDTSPDHSQFREFVRKEAKELASTAFGGTLIGVLGYVYEEQGNEYLGFKSSVSAGLGFNSWSKKAHIFANNYRAMTSVIKTYSSAKRAQAEIEKDESLSSNSADHSKREKSPIRVKQMEESLGNIVETMWNITVLDVESTLRSVCFKVVKDSSVDHADRVKRAEGLVIMGQIFQEFGKPPETGLNEVTAKFKGNLPE